MSTLTKRPIQVYLEERQDRILRALAESKKVSIAELIRRSVDRYLEELPLEDDPAMKIVGLGEGPSDLAERHDTYLIQLEHESNRR
jgi:hypothetical protein